ncbi:MAG: hypothetical protein RJA34_376, partial [Pseudomonadota bacterium]
GSEERMSERSEFAFFPRFGSSTGCPEAAGFGVANSGVAFLWLTFLWRAKKSEALPGAPRLPPFAEEKSSSPAGAKPGLHRSLTQAHQQSLVRPQVQLAQLSLQLGTVTLIVSEQQFGVLELHLLWKFKHDFVRCKVAHHQQPGFS